MFDISSAPENFQKILKRILLSCDIVVNFVADIVVFGRTEAEHDIRLKKVLDVLKENNVLLDDGKYIYKVRLIHFLG